MKEEDKKTFYELVDEYLKKLNEVIDKKDLSIEAHVKYKIINLIERSKNNWEKSKFEKSIEAKGKKDLEEEDEYEKTEKEKSTKNLFNQDEIIEEIAKDLLISEIISLKKEVLLKIIVGKLLKVFTMNMVIQ